MANNHPDDFWKAVLMYSYGYKQTEIAEALGGAVSQPVVSRYIREARSEGSLYWKVRWPQEMNTRKLAEIQESVLSREDRERLESKLKAWTPPDRPPVQRLHVVYAEPPQPDAGDEAKGGGVNSSGSDISSVSFGRNVAPYICGLISSVDICVVAWGRTIRNIVDAIDSDMKARPDLKVLPLCGEPLNHTDNAISPSVAAAAVARAFRSNFEYSLRGVPARIPKDVNPVELRKFVERCDDYKEIFTSDEPLVKKVDMVLMSVGNSASSATDPLYRDTVDSENLDDQFRAITAGNLGGIWLPEARNTEEQNDQIDDVNSRWLGMSKVQIESCCSRAAHSGSDAKPGVVIVARESAKAHIVRQSLGMVNTLVISRELANALLAMD